MFNVTNTTARDMLYKLKNVKIKMAYTKISKLRKNFMIRQKNYRNTYSETSKLTRIN